ncbi:MAG: tetratricopeptide repeat protein [Flavobacteriales bacterium]|jgi:tetratricopeptide (TPR) repeat protein
MKMKGIILIVLVLFTISPAAAQPGGGGGLVIENILGPDSIVALSNDNRFEFFLRSTNLKLKSYDALIQYPFSFPYMLNWGYTSDRGLKAIQPQLNENFNQLVIGFNGQWMVVEFVDLLGANGMGRVQPIRRFQFMPGYYVLSLGNDPDPKKQIDAPLDFLRVNYEEWRKLGLVQKRSLGQINSNDFLPAERLAQGLFAYQALANPQKAIDWVNPIIASEKDPSLVIKAVELKIAALRTLERNMEAYVLYKEAKQVFPTHTFDFTYIDMLVAAGQYNEALEIHDKICAQSDYPWDYYNRGKFLENYLASPDAATEDYNRMIARCAKVDLSGADVFKYCEFSKGFLARGLLEFKQGRGMTGSEDLLSYMSFYNNELQAAEFVASADSLLNSYPQYDLLRLATAWGYIRWAQFYQDGLKGGELLKKADEYLNSTNPASAAYMYCMARAESERLSRQADKALEFCEYALKIATEPRAVHRMCYVIYLTILPNETMKIKEAYESWGGK